MQRLTIPRVIPLAALVLVGGQIGQAIAADTVVLSHHETGDEIHRVQHDPVTDSGTNGSEVDTALSDVQWHADSYPITAHAAGRKDTSSRRVGIGDMFRRIVRPIRLPTLFSVPVELDLFGVAKRRNSQAILLRTHVKGGGFELSVSCPL